MGAMETSSITVIISGQMQYEDSMPILLNDDDACIDFKGQIQLPVHHHDQDTRTSMNVISFQHSLFPNVVISVMAIIIFTLVT